MVLWELKSQEVIGVADLALTVATTHFHPLGLGGVSLPTRSFIELREPLLFMWSSQLQEIVLLIIPPLATVVLLQPEILQGPSVCSRRIQSTYYRADHVCLTSELLQRVRMRLAVKRTSSTLMRNVLRFLGAGHGTLCAYVVIARWIRGLIQMTCFSCVFSGEEF